MSFCKHLILGAGQPLITFSRMLVMVLFGLLTVFFDGRLMYHKGLHREGLWARIMGWSLVAVGICSWLAFKVFGDY